MTHTAVVRSPTGDRRDATHLGALAAIAGPQLTISEHHVGRRAVLAVAGEVDIATSADLRTAIEAAGARAFEVWVDLSDTTFMDSSGLHAMAEARARLIGAKIRFVVVCPEGPVLRALTLTGLDRIFEIHASRRAANHAIAA